MENHINCCNYRHSGRIYNIGTNTYFVFIDECFVCGQPIAEIKTRRRCGELVTNLRRVGKAAIKLYEKYAIRETQHDYKTFRGTQAKEYAFYNKYGVIYNDNGIRIAKQEEFNKMKRYEINAILNKRFYKTSKIKIF